MLNQSDALSRNPANLRQRRGRNQNRPRSLNQRHSQHHRLHHQHRIFRRELRLPHRVNNLVRQRSLSRRRVHHTIADLGVLHPKAKALVLLHQARPQNPDRQIQFLKNGLTNTWRD
jgi:hypothetical protein